MTPTQWYTQTDPGAHAPDMLIRHQDDRVGGAMPDLGVFGFFYLAKNRGRWERNDRLAADVSGFGGYSGIRPITEAEARQIEIAWLAPDADAAP